MTPQVRCTLKRLSLPFSSKQQRKMAMWFYVECERRTVKFSFSF